ncbi:MAG: 50S ribosomal protein L6 [Patescibacteria group bacterium]|nr:50S ribosomal protein L6 [Patescibacteria group bacterium]
MSRIGIQPIQIPEKVSVEIKHNQVLVSGPKGTVVVPFRPEVGVELEGDQLVVRRKSSSRFARALHGTVRATLANAVEGVQELHEKNLVLKGLGYRARKQKDQLVLDVGFSHPVSFNIPQDLQVTVEGRSEISIKGADKAEVGKFASEVRSARPPEPYQGEGIRYKGEKIRRKPGKAAKMGEGFGA